MHVDITPMIDIVFLLIIFFMVTAQVARLSRAELDLPQEAGEQDDAADEAGLVINITANGELLINVDEPPLTIEDLRQRVQKEIDTAHAGDSEAIKLMVRADRGGTTGVLNDVLAMLQQIDVGVTRIATEVPR